MIAPLSLIVLAALAEARFGQEQAPVQEIQALSNRGNPGEAPTLAGAVPSVLLAGANACDKLILADEIVSTLGDFADVIDAARGLVAAEKNFNPFAVSIPSLCSDAALPATEALRGILPLVDPAVDGSDIANANSAQSLASPFAASGLSVADVAAANGFTNFTAQASDGSTSPAPAAPDAPAPPDAAPAPDVVDCGSGQVLDDDLEDEQEDEQDDDIEEEPAATVTVTVTVTDCPAGATEAPEDNQEDPLENPPNGGGAGGALDFGSCSDPSIIFADGLDGRQGGSFAPNNKGDFSQGSALNSKIVTDFICGQLGSACKAPDATVQACRAGQSAAEGLQGQAVADAFNGALGL